jgi:hypothetical protein
MVTSESAGYYLNGYGTTIGLNVATARYFQILGGSACLLKWTLIRDLDFSGIQLYVFLDHPLYHPMNFI